MATYRIGFNLNMDEVNREVIRRKIKSALISEQLATGEVHVYVEDIDSYPEDTNATR